MMHYIIFLIALVTSPACADECQGKYNKNLDICQILRQMSNEMAKGLPMQMDSSMSMTKVYSIGNTIAYEATYQYDMNELQNCLSKLGWSNEQFNDYLIRNAKNRLCQSEALSLIKNGAIFHYDYIFIDQTPYFSFEISQCYRH
jgi:hypothetical protein